MTIRVGINGFGRIGRLVVRALLDKPDLELVHINDVHSNAKTSAHLLEFDSIHGRLGAEIATEDETLSINYWNVTHSSFATPGEVDWAGRGVDLVLEASGEFRTTELLTPYLEGGVKKVIVAAPVKSEGVLNIVMGCNDDLYDPAENHIITAASCTKTCVAPAQR